MPGDYGSVSNRVGIHASANLLADAKQLLILNRWAQQEDVPQNKGKIITWRRYLNLDTVTDPIVGSNTPDPNTMTWVDVSAELHEFGKYIPISRAVMDTVEDPILQVAQEKSSYQMAKSLDTLIFKTIVGGTQKVLTNGLTRSSINTVMARKHIRAAVRTLLANDAMPLTSLVRSTPTYATHGLEPAFFGYGHTNIEPMFRAMSGFLPTSEYSSNVEPIPGEIGTVERVRIVLSNIAAPWTDASNLGATGGTNVIEDVTTSKAIVYPFIIVAADAYGVTKLAGKGAAKILVYNPTVCCGDPLAQRGSVGWITWFASAILNNNFMIRIETAVPSDAGLA